ncbi:MAG: hypothetical protein IIB00_01650 [candidate division Zixibacteria bacterium]|nr:hypothetical protein [candidate division Zixibacteria bacterium]
MSKVSLVRLASKDSLWIVLALFMTALLSSSDSLSKTRQAGQSQIVFIAASPLVVQGRLSETVGLKVRLNQIEVAAIENADVVFMPFPISEDESLPLELERFDVVTPSTKFLIASATGAVEIPAPKLTLLRGKIEGQPNSRVFLSLRASGGGNGYVTLENGQTYLISSPPRNTAELSTDELVVTKLNDNRFGELPEGVDFCGVTPDGFLNQSLPLAPTGGSQNSGAQGALTYRGVKTAFVAVDGDQAYAQMFSDSMAAAAYVVELIAGASAIFERDVNMRLKLTQVRLYSGGGEPFPSDDVFLFRDWWVNNEDTTGLNYVHLFSGRRDLPFGGIAFVTAACSDFSYGISGYLNGAFTSPLENFSLNNWDLTVMLHEMGHNSGTLHTHDGFTPTIDSCGKGVPSRGTIMSYCHIHTGYLTNIDVRFHSRVQNTIVTSIESAGCVIYDCNNNGIDDSIDIVNTTSFDVNSNGVPDECEDCNGNDTLDTEDISSFSSLDVNGNGIPDECEADCNGNGIPDEFEIDTTVIPAINDLNGNLVLDECEPDCNGNSIPDFSEIASGAVKDDDRDNIPDECQDCDANGVADWIDMEGQNNIFVADLVAGGNLIRQYHARSGWPVEQHAITGEPYDVTFGPDNRLYVADFFGGRILQIDPDMGTTVEFVPAAGGVTNPSALVFGADGHLYVADFQLGSVQKFDGSTGADLGVFAPAVGGLVGPMGLVFGPGGNLYVNGLNNNVNEYDGSTGTLVGTFISAGDGGLSGPRGMVFLASGNLVVASYNTNQLLEYDGSTGAFVKVFSDEQDLDQPWGVKIGPNGNIFVARGGSVPRVLEYVPEGRYHRYYIRNNIDMESPTGLAFRPQSQFDCNGNGVLDICDVSNGLTDECLPGCCSVAGDADNSGDVTVADAIFIIKYIFQDGDAPPCLDQADSDGSDGNDISDATFLVKYIFQEGSDPICGTTGT